jgi:hypothetical protein
MTAPDQPPRTNAWGARLAALGLASLFGALATRGLAAQGAAPPPDRANVAFADEKDADEQDDIAARLEDRLKELGDRVIKELGPAGEEVRKAWDRAVARANETLEEEGFSGEGLREAIDNVRDEVSSALEEGSPIDREVRRALDRIRRELSEIGERSGRDIHETMRRRFLDDRVEKADRKDDDKEKAEDGKARSDKDGHSRTHEQIDEARKEVRELERKLHEAVRRLYVLQRQATREDRPPQGRRRGPGVERQHDSGDNEEAHERHRPSDSDEAESPQSGRGPRRRMPRLDDESFRGRGFGFGRGPLAGPPPGMRPGPDGRQRRDDDRRLRELEEKMDKILKRLDRMNGTDNDEKTPKKSEDEGGV